MSTIFVDAERERASWLSDLHLMHHYSTSTCASMVIKGELQSIWKYDFPQIALTSPFLMRGILGIAAIDLARLKPEMHDKLIAVATRHLNVALKSFRETLPVPAADNCNALLAFSMLVVIFAFALPPRVAPIDAIGEIFKLTRGTSFIMMETYRWVKDGPFKPMLQNGNEFDETPTFEPMEYKHIQCAHERLMHYRIDCYEATKKPTELVNCKEDCSTSMVNHAPESLRDADASRVSLPEGIDFGLSYLDTMMECGDPTEDERILCTALVKELQQLYARMFLQAGKFSMGSIAQWPNEDPTNFVKLLDKRSPHALVVLAHYCVLFYVLQGRWWVQGWATRLLTDIAQNLAPEWQHWISLPVLAVLGEQQAMEPRSGSNPADPLDMLFRCSLGVF
ncbi:hypothetical protein LTR50_001192 [Elasticomyces elasticus]|nr:hypothetical protein LTR50_001192 [Elasticomyces elasticus]